CVHLDSDGEHCGACGLACTGGRVCSRGACADACAAGLEACGASCVDASSHDLHCGGREQPCGGGAQCVGGLCTCAGAAACADAGTHTREAGAGPMGGADAGDAGSAGNSGACEPGTTDTAWAADCPSAPASCTQGTWTAPPEGSNGHPLR